MVQPSANKLIIETEKASWRQSNSHFWNINNEDIWSIDTELLDSIPLNNVAVKVTNSKDNLFHIFLIKTSRGKNIETARNLAGKIEFNILQQDSIIHLPRNFMIATKDKFRNQQVVLIIEVPTGKKIILDESVNTYDVFDINRKGFSVEIDSEMDTWSDLYRPMTGTEYIMQPNGQLEMLKRLDPDALQKGVYKVLPEKENDWNNEPSQTPRDHQYRYKAKPDDKPVIIDTAVSTSAILEDTEIETTSKATDVLVDGTVNLFSRFLEF
jgi:hypothetical protein